MPHFFKWHLGLLSLFFSLTFFPLFGGFTVTPLLVDFTAKAGSEASALLMVRNTSSKDLTVDIQAKDFDIDPDGQEREQSPGSVERGCASWLSLSPVGMVSLKGGESREVRMTLDTPPRISGSYWAKVYIEESSRPEPIVQQKGDVGMTLFIRQRWEIRVHEQVPGTARIDAEVMNMALARDRAERPTLQVALENLGNSMVLCQGRLEIRDEGGELVSEQALNSTEAPNFRLYPEKERVLTTLLPPELTPGTYTALAIVEYGDEGITAGQMEFEISDEGA